MKRILRDVKTGLLFKNLDEWTAHFEDAYGFPDTLSALSYCRQHHLGGVEIVLRFPDGSRDVILGFRRAITTEPTLVNPILSKAEAKSALPEVAAD